MRKQFRKAGPGRPKGLQNKVTRDIKEMVLGALEDVGGQKYLARQAIENPTAYMALLGKVIPKEINAHHTHDVERLSDAELAAEIAAIREALRGGGEAESDSRVLN